MKNVWQILFLSLIVCETSCVSYKGSIPSGTLSGRNDVHYVSVAYGYSRVSYFFGIGGSKTAGLYQDARQNLLEANKLIPAQYFGNITTDVRTTRVWPFQKRELLISADILEPIGDHVNAMGESSDSTVGAWVLGAGDSVRMVMDLKLIGGRVLQVRDSRVTVAFKDLGTNKLRIKDVNRANVFRFETRYPLFVKQNLKVGQLVTYGSSSSGSGKGSVMGINEHQVLLRTASGYKGFAYDQIKK